MRLAEWCRTVIPSEGIFKSHQTTSIDSISCNFTSTIAFKLNYALFYNLKAIRSTLRSRNVQFDSYLWCWCQNVSQKKSSKLTPKCQKDVLMSCTRPPPHTQPPCKTTFPCTGQWRGNSSAEHARIVALICNSRHDCFMMLLCLQNIYMQRYDVCCHDNLQCAAQWA